MAVVPIKSKAVAYLLWFFLGFFGAHRFYLEKIGTGILWFFTLGLLGIGWFIDLFTLGGQVDTYNLLRSGRGMGSSGNQNQNVVVNVTVPPATLHAATDHNVTSHITTDRQTKISAENAILLLADKMPVLTLRQIMTNANLDMEEAETAIRKLIGKGIAKEELDSSGKSTYTFTD